MCHPGLHLRKTLFPEAAAIRSVVSIKKYRTVSPYLTRTTHPWTAILPPQFSPRSVRKQGSAARHRNEQIGTHYRILIAWGPSYYCPGNSIGSSGLLLIGPPIILIPVAITPIEIAPPMPWTCSGFRGGIGIKTGPRGGIRFGGTGFGLGCGQRVGLGIGAGPGQGAGCRGGVKLGFLHCRTTASRIGMVASKAACASGVRGPTHSLINSRVFSKPLQLF